MSVHEYYAEFEKYMICRGIVEDTKDKIVRFYGGLRNTGYCLSEKFYTINHLFLFDMLAEKESQGCQQRNWSSIGNNLTNQVLARVEQVIKQAFAKVDVDNMMSKQTVASTTAIASPPPSSTPTLEYGKILNPTEIVRPDRESCK